MFSLARKQAQQTAQRLLAGHCGLIAWWTLRHAGVLDAMKTAELEEKSPLSPLVHATKTNMAADVLEALLDYLASAGLVALKNGTARLTGEGHALLEHEDGVLGLIRGYQPILDMSEHLLAKLKTVSGSGGGPSTAALSPKKAEYLLDAQAKRFATEVFPAVAELVAKHKLTHLLDITCGTGELLIHTGRQNSRAVGVGIGSESAAVRRANAAINEAQLDKRFLAVTANAYETCTDTQRTFDRIGISRQLWKSIDCLIATHLSAELPPSGPISASAGSDSPLHRALAGIAKNFPGAHLILLEPVATPRFDKNYYAPELSLLLRLSKSAPQPPETWRSALAAAGFVLVQESPLTTDGLAIFLCKPEEARHS